MSKSETSTNHQNQNGRNVLGIRYSERIRNTMGLNSDARLARLRQKLAEKELDGIFIPQPENRFYLSGFDGSAGYLVITAKDAILATDFRYVEQSKAESPDYDVIQITGKLEGWFPNLVERLGVRRLGFESEQVVVAFHRHLTDTLSKAGSTAEMVPVEGLVESLRIVKEPAEIALIRKAVEISDNAIAHIVQKIRPGMTEIEAAWEIESFMRENGSQPVPFEVIVPSDRTSAL